MSSKPAASATKKQCSKEPVNYFESDVGVNDKEEASAKSNNAEEATIKLLSDTKSEVNLLVASSKDVVLFFSRGESCNQLSAGRIRLNALIDKRNKEYLSHAKIVQKQRRK